VDKADAWLRAIDQISLGVLREEAERNKRAVKPRAAIAAMLFVELRKRFGQSGLVEAEGALARAPRGKLPPGRPKRMAA
jgi:hypothetical protein